MTTKKHDSGPLKQSLLRVQADLKHIISSNPNLHQSEPDHPTHHAYRTTQEALANVEDSIAILQNPNRSPDNPLRPRNNAATGRPTPEQTPMETINISLGLRASNEIPGSMSPVLGEYLRGIQPVLTTTVTTNPGGRSYSHLQPEPPNNERRPRPHS